jgi:hypothetical protein
MLAVSANMTILAELQKPWLDHKLDILDTALMVLRTHVLYLLYRWVKNAIYACNRCIPPMLWLVYKIVKTWCSFSVRYIGSTSFFL